MATSSAPPVVDLTQDTSSDSDGDRSIAPVAPSKRARHLPVSVWVLVKSELPEQ